MRRARYTKDGLLTRRAARRIMRPYVLLLGRVINEAWATWLDFGAQAPGIRLKIGRSARAFTLADFIKDEVEQRFAKVKGCEVVMEYGRPVLVLAGGDLKLRLGKIDLDGVPYPRNARQLQIWAQLDAVSPKLLATPSGTWAKCGYVLDATETRIVSITVKCDLEGVVKWMLALPIPAAKRPATEAAPLQSAVVPSAKIASALPTSSTASGHGSSAT